MTRVSMLTFIFIISALVACGPDGADSQTTELPEISSSVETPDTQASPEVAFTPLLILEDLSADDMGGRQTGTEGHAKAQAYLLHELRVRGLSAEEQAFTFENRAGEPVNGLNLLARIEGKRDGPVMGVTAHYDHVGIQNGEIYNGADDDASGTVALLAIAAYFQQNKPEHTLVLAAVDA